MNTDYDIVIVGGGAASIGAARRLAAGRRSTLLIEASCRVGGRARTEKAAGLSLDLGCGWLLPPTATLGQLSPRRQVSPSTAESRRGAFSTATWGSLLTSRLRPEKRSRRGKSVWAKRRRRPIARRTRWRRIARGTPISRQWA